MGTADLEGAELVSIEGSADIEGVKLGEDDG